MEPDIRKSQFRPDAKEGGFVASPAVDDASAGLDRPDGGSVGFLIPRPDNLNYPPRAKQSLWGLEWPQSRRTRNPGWEKAAAGVTLLRDDQLAAELGFDPRDSRTDARVQSLNWLPAISKDNLQTSRKAYC